MIKPKKKKLKDFDLLDHNLIPILKISFLFFFLSFWLTFICYCFIFQKIWFVFDNIDNARFGELCVILVCITYTNMYIFIASFETALTIFFCFELHGIYLYLQYHLYIKLKKSILLMYLCLIFQLYFYYFYTDLLPLYEDPFWFNYPEFVHLKKDNNMSWVYYDGTEDLYTERDQGNYKK